MGEYKKTAIIVVITLIVTTIFNWVLSSSSSFFRAAPNVEITSGDIILPSAIPDSILDIENMKVADNIVQLFEKYKPESEYFNSYDLKRFKDFMEKRSEFEKSSSEFLLEKIKQSGSLQYTLVKISNHTDTLLTDISVVAKPDDKIFDTNYSVNKNYKIDISDNKANIESISPGESIVLYCTSKDYYFDNPVRVLYKSELLPLHRYQVSSNDPLGYLVSLSNSGFFYGVLIAIVFFIGFSTILILIIAGVVQIFSGSREEKSSDQTLPAIKNDD